jgi:hypothetical protein
MKQFSSAIVFALLFSSVAFSQSAQTSLNSFPPATTRIAGPVNQVQIKGNVGQQLIGTITSQSGVRFISGTWRTIIRLRGNPISVDEPAPQVPSQFWVGQNFPNPFNPTTTIPFTLEKQGRGYLTILNLLGQTVRTVDLSGYSEGAHEFLWDGRSDFGLPVSSGPLFYRVTTDQHTALHRMLLLK